MNFLPKFMRTPTWALLGTGFVGSTIYMTYKSRLDTKLNHTLVQESIHLLENNEEVIELVGAPLIVDSNMRNRADIGDNISNFTYYVSGPRGQMRVELASCARNLSGLGPNSKGKQLLEDLNSGISIEDSTANIQHDSPTSNGSWFGWIFNSKNNTNVEAQSEIKEEVKPNQQSLLKESILKRIPKSANGKYPIPTNISEFNYNNYYIPDPEVVKTEQEIYQMIENNEIMPSNSKFWNIEYMFAELDGSVRIMVAPIPEAQKAAVS